MSARNLRPRASHVFVTEWDNRGGGKKTRNQCQVLMKYNVDKNVTTGIMKACLKYFQCTGWHLNL